MGQPEHWRPDSERYRWDRAQVDFGLRVRQLRQARGLSQARVAEWMTSAGFAMHQSTVTKLESGVRPTSVGELAALAALFGLQPDQLLGGAEDQQVEADAESVYLTARTSVLAEAEREAERNLTRIRESFQATVNRLRVLHNRSCADCSSPDFIPSVERMSHDALLVSGDAGLLRDEIKFEGTDLFTPAARALRAHYFDVDLQQ